MSNCSPDVKSNFRMRASMPRVKTARPSGASGLLISSTLFLDRNLVEIAAQEDNLLARKLSTHAGKLRCHWLDRARYVELNSSNLRDARE